MRGAHCGLSRAVYRSKHGAQSNIDDLLIYTHICFSLKPYTEMKIVENSFPPYDDLQFLGMLLTYHIIPHTTLGNA